MTLSDIMNMWEKDAKMDQTELGEESVKIPLLHHKYYKVFVDEGLLYKKLEADYKALYKLKFEYYLGILDQETLQEKGWEPNGLKISSAVQKRCIGTAFAISSLRASVNSAVISVSTNPGAITFAVMPLLPSSRANDLAIPSKPALLAE